jgi:hypothetical protein
MEQASSYCQRYDITSDNEKEVTEPLEMDPCTEIKID